VTRRLKAALCDLKTVVPAERRPPIDRQLELLEAGARRGGYEDPDDAEAAVVGDQQGIGSGPDLVMRHADTADRLTPWHARPTRGCRSRGRSKSRRGASMDCSTR
jgi:hypothetical protein